MLSFVHLQYHRLQCYIQHALEIDHKLDGFESEVHNPFSVPRGLVAKYIFRGRRIRKIAQKTLSSEQRSSLAEKFLLTKKEKPKMDEKSTSMLTKYYEDDVHKLENFLGRKLPWPNFQSN